MVNSIWMKRSSWSNPKDMKNWIKNGMYVNYSTHSMDLSMQAGNGMMLSAECLQTQDLIDLRLTQPFFMFAKTKTS